MLLSNRSVLAGQYGRLCWHRGQIRRRHHGWRGRCHRWRFRHHGAWLPTAAAGLGADRLPGRLELVGGLAAQLVKLGHGLLGDAFDLRPLPQPPGRLGELLIALSAGLGPQHISGGPTGGHAEGSAPSPSAATRPNPPGTLADRFLGRLDAGPRPPATLHGNRYRQQGRAGDQSCHRPGQGRGLLGGSGHRLVEGLGASAPTALAGDRCRDGAKPAHRRAHLPTDRLPPPDPNRQGNRGGSSSTDPWVGDSQLPGRHQAIVGRRRLGDWLIDRARVLAQQRRRGSAPVRGPPPQAGHRRRLAAARRRPSVGSSAGTSGFPAATSGVLADIGSSAG